MYDVVIVGGGVAGLSAALTLGRGRRRVLVIDGGAPRNAPSSHAHGFLSRDGISPLELLRTARDDLREYPNVEFRRGDAQTASRTDGGFILALADGDVIETRKLLLATGVIDVLPDIEGMAELWGRGVNHCPYCHGWEIRDRTWAMLDETTATFDRVALYRNWAADLVILSNGVSQLDSAERDRLAKLGVSIDERRVARVGHAEGDDVLVSFENGESLVAGGIFAAPPQVQRSSIPEVLGCELDELGPTGSRYVRVDATTGESTVSGVYAAGDMVGPMQFLSFAAASGVRAAAALNRAFVIEEAEAVLAGPVASQDAVTRASATG